MDISMVSPYIHKYGVPLYPSRAAPGRSTMQDAIESGLEFSHEALASHGPARMFMAPYRVALVVRQPAVKESPPVADPVEKRRHLYQIVVVAAQVSPGARPRPVLRLLDKSRAHRIKLDIAGGGQEMGPRPWETRQTAPATSARASPRAR